MSLLLALLVLSILHTLDSRFCLVAKRPRLNVSESVTLVPSHLQGTSGETSRRGRKDERRKQEREGVLRDSWLLVFVSLFFFYFTSCQMHLPAVNFMCCFFTICTRQGDHKLHLRVYKNVSRFCLIFPVFFRL